jgi:hypothetical protein
MGSLNTVLAMLIRLNSSVKWMILDCDSQKLTRAILLLLHIILDFCQKGRH